MKPSFPTLPRITADELLFSAKTFAAAMLALYIASRAGLERPFWAMTTAYVVSSPLAGTVRSKALFRLCGTFIGSAATVVIVPTLSNSPELLTLTLALWVGVCLYVSLLDRTPRSYIFMLAGYTAALIAFPSVETPQLLFDTAVLRVEEIGLGILCATLVHSVVLPQGLAPSVLGLLDRAQRDARQWLADLFGAPTQPSDAKALQADRNRLASDLTQLRLLSTHIPFDTTNLRWTAGAMRAMQDRLAALTPALSATEDRLRALVEAEGALPEDVARVLGQAQRYIDQSTEAIEDAALPALRAAIRELPQASAEPWIRALRIALVQGLDELLDGWQACARLRRDIDSGLMGKPVPSRSSFLRARTLHRDHGMALLSGLAAVIAICLCSAFWILTGWASGAVATMMAAVFCSFFATMDDPVPAIHGFLKFTLWSVPISAIYVLALLPMVQDFGMLVAVCAPTFLLIGCFIARPATFGAAMALAMGVATTLALHDTANADMAGFLNSVIGQVVGVLVAARVTRVVRSVGTQWTARRIQRATWRELAEMAAAPKLSVSAQGYAARMLDRIGLLAPRIAQAGGSIEGVLAEDTLKDLRMGADIVALQRNRRMLPAAHVGPVLASVSAFLQARASGQSAQKPAQLQAHIDALLNELTDAPSAVQPDPRPAIAALVGLRRNLFPEAPATLQALA